MNDCLFCKIVFGDIPCDKIFESELLIAFRDIAPVSPTHILIIPKKHISSLNEMEDEDMENDSSLAIEYTALSNVLRSF